jgi:hypothetical protein
MSSYLRNPWIRRAVQQGGAGALRANPAAQIIAADYVGNESQASEEADGANAGGEGGMLVAQLSDKDVWVYAVFTPHALLAFERDEDFGRPLTALRGGIVHLTR